MGGVRIVSGGKEAGLSGGAELHVIVPGKLWGSAEEVEGEERRRGQARTNAIRTLEIESTILPVSSEQSARVRACARARRLFTVTFISSKRLHPSLHLSVSQFDSR